MAYSAEVLADNPLHYWDMASVEGALQFDKGSVKVAVGGQSSNRGGFSGPASDVGAVYLDGSSSFLTTPRNGAYVPAPGTLELWFWEQAQTTAANGYIANFNTNTGTNYLIASASTGFYAWAMGAYSNNVFQALDFNVWHQFVFLIGTPASANCNVTLYVDGLLKDGPHLTATAPQNGLISIGRQIAGANQWANGLIGPVSTYGSVLSAARILDHYNAADLKAAIPTYRSAVGFLGPAPTLTTLESDIEAALLAAVRKTFPTT